ncbi:BON domain-containing protein [Catenovulum sp. 2E275]|uniref:BON domain-containing protein n=1 Tax=Catenovulum sp. 2E275 TaxID=2980497 RepID=UPI0021D170AB|nr:BON domain-containing protein [Catenovulum sp. 2E275]MCU4676669.1 BON domain-containing protein [Catenovulum sp. 2E275]
MKFFKLLLIGFALTQLTACAVAVFAGAAGTTAVVASDRRDVDTQVADHELEKGIQHKLNHDPAIAKQSHVTVVSYNKNVLLVGQAPTDFLLDKIVKMATEDPNLADLYNEVRIAENSSTAQRTQDTWLTTKLKTRMLADKELDGHQVKIITENGEVFLMGKLTEHEQKIAVTIARNMSGVKRVIDIFEPYTKPANDN